MKLIVLKNHVPLHDVTVDTSDSGEAYEIYVGRSEDCHVQIDDPLISRHHFVLKNDNDNWFCEKLSQLGVITLNGSLVTKSKVTNGDELKCGAYSIIVAELPDHQAATASPQVSQVIPEYTPPAPQPVETVTEIIQTPVEDEPVAEDISETESLATQEQNDFEELPSSSQLSDDLGGIGSYDNDQVGDNQFSSTDELSSEGADFGGGELTESDGFNNEGDAMDDGFGMPAVAEENESTRFFKAFVNYQLVLFGEHAPYDRFLIDQEEIFIGRDPQKCQIVLNDPEVSSVHAVLRKTNIEITLEDLNSSNGTILNAERINKAQITAGDEFVIGSTSFTLEVRSDLLETESERLMPVESNQVVETEEIVEEEIVTDGDINFDAEAPPEKSLVKRFQKDPKFRKKVIYIACGLGLFWLFAAPDEQPVVEKKAPPVQKVADKNAKPKRILTKEQENARNVAYELGVSFFEQSRYDLAQIEFQKVVAIDPEYKKVQSYLEQTNVGLKRLEELEAQRRAEEDRIKTKKIIDELLVKAREAVKNRQVQVAESYFSQITEKDPENIEVSQLRLELEAWQKEEERKALELAAKEAARKKMVDALTPGKTFYLKKEWYKAILKLEEFLRIKSMDEDLIKEASDMLSDAKNQLASELGPLLGKARSLKEGQDYKAAYEAFLEILKIEPTNAEALNEVDEIKSQLEARSKKIYREAIIAESLSLFADAKEKFQEVQQISPTDSEYYKKASDKLRNYLE